MRQPEKISIPSAPKPFDWRPLLTQAAFWMAIVLVYARCAITESFRNVDPVLPGVEAAPAAPGPATSLFLDLLCCVPALLVLLRRVLDPTYIVRWAWSHAAMFALAAWTLLSIGWAADRFAAMVQAMDFASSLVLLWSMTQLVRSWLRLRLVAASALGVLLILAAYGLDKRFIEFPMQVGEWNNPEGQSSRWRYMKEHGLQENEFRFTQFEKKLLSGELQGFSNSPNTYAAILVLTIVITIGLLAQRMVNREHWGWSIATAAAIIPAMIVLRYTHSRTAVLTLLLAIGVLCALRWMGSWLAAHARPAYWTGVAGLAAALVLLIAVGLVRGNLVDKSLTFRWYYWSGAARLLKTHPVAGIGWGSFGVRYPQVRSALAVEEPKDPHNFLVRAFAELGLIGGLLMIGWMGRMWWELTRSIIPPMPKTTPTSGLRPDLRALLLLSLLAGVLRFFLIWDPSHRNDWALLEGVETGIGAALLLLGLGIGSLRTLKDEGFDHRPCPWVLHGMIVACGVFLLHNLIDFSLFEAGPMFLFAMVMGSALGLRQPSLAGKRKQTAVAICIFSAATVFWVFAAIIFWGRTAMAESAAGEGDRLVRLAAKAGSQEINPALLQAAAAQYATARKRQPLEGEYAYKEAQVLVSLGADALWVRGLLETACTANPYSGKYFAAKAQYELSRAGVDHQPVKEAYQRMLELDPRNVAARLDYAEALLKMGEDGAALDQFKEALRQNDALPADEPKRLSAQRREELEKQIARLAR